MSEELDAPTRRRIGRRVAWRMAPTIGAVLMFIALAALLAWSDYTHRAGLEKTRAEALVVVCEQSNDMRRAVRTSNTILAELMGELATRPNARTRELLNAARGALEMHSEALAPVACRDLPPPPPLP